VRILRTRPPTASALARPAGVIAELEILVEISTQRPCRFADQRVSEPSIVTSWDYGVVVEGRLLAWVKCSPLADPCLRSLVIGTSI
jgi:hypothetical protein